jgi:signal peptide peptidase SppA
MKYAHIIHYFNSQPWAILPEKLEAIISLIELKAAGLTLTASEIDARMGPSRTEVISPSSVAVLPIVGTISHRANMLKRASGGMSVEEFQKDFRAAVNNPEIAAIVLDIDSPGGSTSGIEELANEIFEARSQKRIVASVNSLAASAAYHLASSAHEIAVTPSGHAGSIGVMGIHMDFSEQAKKAGATVTIVSSGKYKAEASEFTPLTAEARQHLQSLADDRYDAFVRDVAKGRRVPQKNVRNGFGEGRVVAAKDAINEGMVDTIETIEQIIARTAGRAVRAKTIAQAASWKFGLMGDEEVFELGSTVMSATAAEMTTQNRSGFIAQMVVAPKDKWTLEAARAWAKEHDYRADKVVDAQGSWQFRQRDPGDFRSLGRAVDGGMLLIGGRLRQGVDTTAHDPESEGVEEFLSVGVIPQEVSETMAAEGTAWETPVLSDFTAKPWGELDGSEKRRIAMHAAWARAMAPENFEDIRLFYHRASDGAIVPNGVRAALAGIADADLGEDTPRVEAHLRCHMDVIDEHNQAARANPALDPHRVMLELMELG